MRCVDGWSPAGFVFFCAGLIEAAKPVVDATSLGGGLSYLRVARDEER